MDRKYLEEESWGVNTRYIRRGKNVVIYDLASVGTRAESINPVNGNYTCVELGDDVVIREFVTINRGVDQNTVIGEGSYLMAKSHVGHDCILGKNNVLSPGVILGGHTVTGDNVTFGINSSTHQRAIVPSYSMIGAHAFFKSQKKDNPRGLIWVGVPAKPIAVNLVGLSRSTLSAEEREEIINEAHEYLNNND